MEKICCILLVCMFYIMQSVSACQSQWASGSAGPEWDQLVLEGSNYLIRADSGIIRIGRKVRDEILNDGRSKEREKWFRSMVNFSMSTNDMSHYSYWLWKKSDLILITAWMQNSESAWIDLAKFLADVRNKRRKMTLERREELRKELYPVGSKYDFADFRKRWFLESRYQSALNHAETMTTRAFYNLLKQSSEEQKTKLNKILSKVIGEDFVLEFNAKERNKNVERGTNTVKKIKGVVVE